MTTSLEFIHLGGMDTDRSKVKKMREMEDNVIETKIGTHDMVRLLAVKNKLRKQRAKEDKASIQRKKRRAEVKLKLKNRESQDIVDDGNHKEQSEYLKKVRL